MEIVGDEQCVCIKLSIHSRHIPYGLLLHMGYLIRFVAHVCIHLTNTELRTVYLCHFDQDTQDKDSSESLSCESPYVAYIIY